MPLLFKKNVVPSGLLGIWAIEESEDYFREQLVWSDQEIEQLQRMPHPTRRIEWLASRYLLHHLSGRTIRGACLKDAYGKPYLENSPFHISISHSNKLAAVMAAPHLVGVDVQLVVPKIERIASKFLGQAEMDSIQSAHKIEHLHVYWGAKEALFKAYGKKELNFFNLITFLNNFFFFNFLIECKPL
ncbi:MAG: 4'-phosphopantetheinyl transferase superfamily protein [Saprospiraceae bacterium]|nr:4'-phosphopantetheinyl transferase superfamily protein [Saprospiraceae bacterium]